MRTRTVLALFGAVMVMAMPAEAATRSCGTVNDFASQIQASGVGCAKAKRVAKKYTVYTGMQDTTPFGYDCQRKDRPDGSWKVTCSKGSKLISWRGTPLG